MVRASRGLCWDVWVDNLLRTLSTHSWRVNRMREAVNRACKPGQTLQSEAT